MENIALAFSGGGFRAAAYSLGCLSYLNQIQYNGQPLLKNVTFISSTSGGSFANLIYSIGVYEGKPFEECYNKLVAIMNGDEMLSKALERLKSSHPDWKQRPFKSINLINAFSLVYDEILEQKELGLFSNRNAQPHLEEICINSTEFTNGYAFRFQSYNDQLKDKNGFIGNYYIHFVDEENKNGISAAKKIKLGDILASSSCFPSGFEPLLFPDDYSHNGIDKATLFKGLQFNSNDFSLQASDYNNTDFMHDPGFDGTKQFGIMDGGVADNQAIEAFMLADKRRKDDQKQPFSVFISCDVTSYFMDGYSLPVPKNKWYSFISFNMAKWLLIAFITLISAWIPFSVFKFWNDWQWWNTVSCGVAAVFFIPAVVFLIRMLFKKKQGNSTWGTILKKHLGSFTSLSIAKLKTFILTRGKSVFILANDIYLKQIRRLYYDRIYNDPEYKGRIVQNAIYKLSRVNAKNLLAPDEVALNIPPVSDAMMDVAEKARTMGTTLWFDATHETQNMRNSIIATGQFTTCYNLLKYLLKQNAGKQAADIPPAIQQLENDLMQDFKAFCNRPMRMVEGV